MKKLLFFFVMTCFVFLMTACGTGNDKKEETDSSNDKKAETVTIDHELDTTEVPVNPEKIVVFDFGTLDTLDKLGIKVTGVPQGNMPEYLKKYDGDEYENVGSLKEPDFEKISEIDPDLIIISGRQSQLYDQLQEIAPTIFLGVDTTRYMESFKENLDVVGKIFDKKAEIEDELATIDESIASLQEKAKEKNENALITLANDNKVSAYGPNSRFGIIHDVFGVPAVDETIEASTHGMNITFEYIAEKDPDILYVVDRGAAIGEESSAKQVIENKLVEKTKAYKNDKIIYLDPDYWYLSGGGLVSITEMIQEIDTSLD